MKSKLLGFAILLLSAAGLLVPREYLGGSGPLLKSAKDGLHVPGFAVVTLCLALLLRRKEETVPVLKPMIIAIIFAALSELIQPLFNRGAQWHDIASDLAGIAIGTAWLMGFRKFHRKSGRVFLWASLAVVFGIFLFPFASYQRDCAWLAGRFPVLAQFDDSRMLRFFKASQKCGLDIIPSSGGSSGVLEVSKLDADSISFLTLWLPRPLQNWSANQALRVELYNPGAPFHMNFSIGEAGSKAIKDRYIHPFVLESGTTVLTIGTANLVRSTGDRSLDLTRMEQLVFGVPPNQLEPVFHVRRIWLD